MTVFSMLKADHKEAKALFKTLVDDEQMEQPIIEELCDKLLLHMELEEKFYYPVTQAETDTEELAKEAVLEHAEAKKLIQALKKGNLDETETKVKLEMLKLAIEHHVKEEEEELFPESKKTLSAETLDEIASKMTAYKEKHLVGAKA